MLRDSWSNTVAAKQMSPTRALISRMRRCEEEQLQKCINVIKTMKTAIGRQRNVSMGIKNELKELEEAVHMIAHYRTKWKKTEAQIEERVESVAVPTNKTHGKRSSKNVRRKNRVGRRNNAQQEKKAVAKAADNKQQQRRAGGHKKDKPTDKKKKNTQKRRQIKLRLDALLIKSNHTSKYCKSYGPTQSRKRQQIQIKTVRNV